jgi:hypothetical protein
LSPFRWRLSEAAGLLKHCGQNRFGVFAKVGNALPEAA